MDNKQIPSFLLTDINTLDKKKLQNNMRLAVLWLFVNGDKPFDRAEALRLQSHIKAEHEARNRKQGAKLLKEKTERQRNYRELCQAVAEQCFEFELSEASDKVTAGVIAWNSPIKDLRSGKMLATPRSLLNGDHGVSLAWDAPNFDVRTETTEFLAALRKRLDGFEYLFSLTRPYTKPESHFAEKLSEYITFYAKLTWSPLSNRELVRKVAKIISKYKRN